ncbi:MAG: primosomal protein N' [Acutalibacteraceae bacterium]
MTGPVAQVALDGAAFAFDRLYSYIIPPELQSKAAAGMRVTVPFGKGNLKKQGMIFRIESSELKGLKAIYSVTDKSSVLNGEMLSLCEYMRENYFCTYYEAIRAALPMGMSFKLISYYSANEEFSSVSLLDSTEREIFEYLKAKGEKDSDSLKRKFGVTAELLDGLCEKQALILSREPKRKINDANEKWVRPAFSYDELDNLKLTKRQREVCELVSGTDGISVKEIKYFTGVSQSVIDGLISRELLICFEKRVFRTDRKMQTALKNTEITLTGEQQAAFDGLISKYNEQSGNISLLYGITGSGKTQVFLRLADEVSAKGRGVIVMVPEIALTPQMLKIFTERYGDKVAVFHSAMSQGARLDEWERVRSGKALIALGTRSAVFAPFADLGLIIIDEEQEHTYKSEQSPRFHARELAAFRTRYNKGLLCLASATPSVESFTAAKQGKYSLFKLSNRYGGAVLPKVETVDMKKEILGGNSSPVSRRLYEAVNETLDNKKQVILLLNRRGHNTYISCPNCGYVMTCPNCSISLTYHSANHRMMCHYCGYSAAANTKCPQCGNEHMKFLGAGTQKLEEEIKTLFPKARVLRVDADSTLARESYSEYLTAFAEGEYDILLGTQMVAKGLDFPNVTLVGVLGADSAAFSEDFRSFERTFSLLTQVVGRAGRGESAGLAIVQSINPDSELIGLAAKQDYEGFYESEIMTRKLMIYPPYCDICIVGARSGERKNAETAVNGIFSNIKEMLKGEYADVKLIILGPAPASVPVVNGKYRYRMIIKCKNGKRFREMLRRALEIKRLPDTAVIADINPDTVI